MQLPWPTDSEHESTPPPKSDPEVERSVDARTGLRGVLLTQPSGPRRVGRHRADEVELPPAGPDEGVQDTIKASHLVINLAWANRRADILRAVAADEAVEPRFREDAERRLALLSSQAFEAAGRIAIEGTGRPLALAKSMMLLPTIQKTAE